MNQELKRNIQLLRPFYRGLPIIVLMMSIAIWIANRYLKYSTPMYESTAKIKLADAQVGVANSNLYKDFGVFANTNKIGAEVELLKSNELVRKTADILHLDVSLTRIGKLHNAELYNASPIILDYSIINNKLYNQKLALHIYNDSLYTITLPNLQQINGRFNILLKTSYANFLIVRNEPLLKQKPNLVVNDHYELIIRSKDAIDNEIIKNLDIMSVDKDIPVLRINYKDAVPEKAAAIVNTLANVYIVDYVDEKFSSADTTVDFLDKQINTFSNKLSSSESTIENYRTDNNIINFRQETETDLRKIADLKKQLASVQMNLKAISDLNKYIKNGKNNFEELAPNFEAFNDLLSTEMVKKTKELQRERKDLLLRYTPEHEKVQAIDQKITDINNYIIESVNNTENNLTIKYTDLYHTIEEEEKVFQGLPTREKNMTILERDFSLNEQTYRFLQEKRTEAEIAKAAKISFHRIISKGEIPQNPVSPNATIIRVFSAFLAFLFSVTIIYLVHYYKDNVSDEEMIEKNSDIKIAQSIPFFKNKNKLDALYTKWALQLDTNEQLSNGNIIAFNSFELKEGKLFNATHLFNAITLLEKKVFFLDVTKQFDKDHLSVSNYKKFISEIQNIYDVIIIVNFSFNHALSSWIITGKSNINYLVLDTRITKKKYLAEATSLKEDLKWEGVQFILNRAGYTPSIFVDLKAYLNILKLKFKK